MRTKTHHDDATITTSDPSTSTSGARRSPRRFCQVGLAAAVALGTLGATAGLHDVAHAEPATSSAVAPSAQTSASHVLHGTVSVTKNVQLTLTSFTKGVATVTGAGFPDTLNSSANPQRSFDFEFSTDTWFHTTTIEATYRVEGTGEEVWIHILKRPMLDDITEYEVRNVFSHRKAPNPVVQLDYEQTARESFFVSTRTMT